MTDRLSRLKTEIVALGLAYRDPRTSRLAKLMALGVVIYALSPLDFIPDPIPVLGYLDDALLLPIGLWLTLRLIPADVMRDCRIQAATTTLPSSGLRGVLLIGGLWLLIIGSISLPLWLIFG